MRNFRYLSGVSTISHNPDLCKGCRTCEMVCPHQVFAVNGRKAQIADKDGCMECGACVINCRSGAIGVTPGVGCAAYIISAWINGKENATCDCGC
ncbi:MAG: ferredoxin [Proteobacteria bacterium]|nr:ferredoxin [Pseudomonadota bacterium]